MCTAHHPLRMHGGMRALSAAAFDRQSKSSAPPAHHQQPDAMQTSHDTNDHAGHALAPRTPISERFDVWMCRPTRMETDLGIKAVRGDPMGPFSIGARSSVNREIFRIVMTSTLTEGWQKLIICWYNIYPVEMFTSINNIMIESHFTDVGTITSKWNLETLLFCSRLVLLTWALIMLKCYSNISKPIAACALNKLPPSSRFRHNLHFNKRWSW